MNIPVANIKPTLIPIPQLRSQRPGTRIHGKANDTVAIFGLEGQSLTGFNCIFDGIEADIYHAEALGNVFDAGDGHRRIEAEVREEGCGGDGFREAADGQATCL